MKDLTLEEIKEAPDIVSHIYLSSLFEIPVSPALAEEAIKDFPEYFKEEIEHKKKWDLIPETVHSNYWSEYFSERDVFFKDIPKPEGIMSFLFDKEFNKEFSKKNEEARKLFLPIAEKIHNKYYLKYGIEFNGLFI